MRMLAWQDRHTVITDLNAELDKTRPKDAVTGAPVTELDGDAPKGAEPPTNVFVGVYDGHGGARCATHAAARLHLLLGHDFGQWRQAPKAALAAAFERTELELRQIYTSHPDEKSGTCACAAVLRGRKLYVAHVGDCRALLLRSEGHAQACVQLTADHRATEQNESRRIHKAGGQISDGRVWGALMPSRTLGDFPWKDRGPGLVATPEMAEIELTADDRYLVPGWEVIGSDGLFDALSNRQIAKIVCKMGSAAQKVCNELIKEVRKKPSGDDTTLIVVALGNRLSSSGLSP